MTYSIHPVAAMFPLLNDTELDDLAQDIKEHGLQNPITVHEGAIVDGRNRLEACKRAGVEPTYVDWDWTKDISLTDWIISTNLHRRHLNTSQRAMLAARMYIELKIPMSNKKLENLKQNQRLEETPEEDSEETSSGNDVNHEASPKGSIDPFGDSEEELTGDEPSEENPFADYEEDLTGEETPEEDSEENSFESDVNHEASPKGSIDPFGRSSENLAKQLGVSPSTVKRAVKVLQDGDDTLVEAVHAGEVSIGAAAQVAKLPKAKQVKAVSSKTTKAVAKKVRVKTPKKERTPEEDSEETSSGNDVNHEASPKGSIDLNSL